MTPAGAGQAAGAGAAGRHVSWFDIASSFTPCFAPPFLQELDKQRARGQQGAKSPLLWEEHEVDEYLAGSPVQTEIRQRLRVGSPLDSPETVCKLNVMPAKADGYLTGAPVKPEIRQRLQVGAALMKLGSSAFPRAVKLWGTVLNKAPTVRAL